MTQDEAEKLARYVQGIICKAFSRDTFHDDVEKLCDHIISGDHKREIENAAYERAAQVVSVIADEELPEQHWDLARERRTLWACACGRGVSRIRSLIQPPAQKENGE